MNKKGSKSPKNRSEETTEPTKDENRKGIMKNIRDSDVIMEQVGEEDGSMYERSKASAELSAKEAGMASPSINGTSVQSVPESASRQRESKLTSQRHSISTVKDVKRISAEKPNSTAIEHQ